MLIALILNDFCGESLFNGLRIPQI